MKVLLTILILLCLSVMTFANELSDREPQWWKDAGLGMIIHFGPYALYGGEYKGQQSAGTAEWAMFNYKIPVAEYTETAKTFNPTKFDADLWVKTAKDAGVEYLIFTSKHHDGFANFKTDYSDFSLWNYQNMDLLAPLAKACKKYGVKFGLYYSHNLDWHEKNGGAASKELHEQKGYPPSNTWDFPYPPDYDFQQYLNDKALPQVNEITTNYGPVDIIWFDCAFGLEREDAKKFYDLVKKNQPNCMINSRIYEGSLEFSDYKGLGDNSVSAKPTENRTESIITLNNTWGYNKFDNNWKTSEQILSTLTKTSAVNSNLCINVGPKPDGTWPDETMAILKDMADWMKVNKESIYGTSAANGTEVVPMNCEEYVFTRKNNTLYLHFLADVDNVNLYNIKTKIKSIKVLGNPYEIKWSQNKDDYSINIQCTGKTNLTVLKMVCDKDIVISKDIIEQNHGFSLDTLTCSKSDNLDINEMKIITNWYDTKDSISWDIICNEPGEYNATIITASTEFLGQWKGGNKVYLCVNDKDFPISDTKNDGLIEGTGEAWKQAKSNIGSVELKEGANKVTLKASEINKDTYGVSFVKLILTKK